MRPRLLAAALILGLACRETGRVDAATLDQAPDGPRLSVTILAAAADPRIATTREAIHHWNGELARLGRRVRLDTGIVRPPVVTNVALGDASREARLGAGPATSRLRDQLRGVPGNIVVALSDTDLISFSLPWSTTHQGVVAIRRADIPPLTLPNTLRNVVAHELGHALGLRHNGDSTTLMCGRPAQCRPSAFASDPARFFPLTAEDERWLRERWP